MYVLYVWWNTKVRPLDGLDTKVFLFVLYLYSTASWEDRRRRRCYSIGEVLVTLSFRWYGFFLISSFRSSIGAFLHFHYRLPVCTDPAANLVF